MRFNSEYEADILCQECEGKIGVFDDYFSKLIYNDFRQKLNLQLKNENNEEIIVLENDPNYDYAKTKLFFLSLLWRASISSRPFFQKVKFTQEIEEDLRSMILAENPGEIYEYPCKIFLPPLTENPDGSGKGFDLMNMGFTMLPFCYKKDNRDICAFVIMGTQYILLLDKKDQNMTSFSVTKNRFVMAFNTLDGQRLFLKFIIDTMKKAESLGGISHS
jgi:hypothetical protein